MKEKNVMKIYKKTLKIIQNSLKNRRTTNTSELNKLSRDLFGTYFAGVYPVDKLPKLKDRQSCIINLDTSNMPGSHWVSVYKQNSVYHIYDSFGRKHTTILPSLSKLNKTFRDSDLDSEQGVLELNCGQRSIAWLCCVYTLGLEDAMKI
tara:strand:+ start:2939 stop:3385 length:447 start_codon:yes stop_codon:yes gene_type:complete